ncbi:MAG: esterase/lipase family protein [Verrucomicrobiales bacterium]
MCANATGLHQIPRPTQDRATADIVFVHGLGGASHDTWRHGKESDPDHFFWPEALAAELSGCHVWTFGYDAGITQLGSPGMRIGQRAGSLAIQMKNRGLGSRPVIFVTHSMGGLVIKSLICDRPEGECAELIGNIRGIVFCGTPHSGSAFASAAEVLGNFLKVAKTQKHVEEMCRDDVALNQMHDRFRAWHHTHPLAIQTYAESRSLFTKSLLGRWIDLGLVVPRPSANTGLGDSPVDVDADHIELVKPHPGNKPLYDTVYLGVLWFIRQILDLSREPQKQPKDVDLADFFRLFESVQVTILISPTRTP